VQPGQRSELVPLSDVWITANLKETQTADVTPGRPVASPSMRIRAAYHGARGEPVACHRGEVLAPPPDNATGNFTKVVQRIPVRVRWTGRTIRRVLAAGDERVVTITTK